MGGEREGRRGGEKGRVPSRERRMSGADWYGAKSIVVVVGRGRWAFGGCGGDSFVGVVRLLGMGRVGGLKTKRE